MLVGGDCCVTVVTSRHHLAGLIVTDSARPVAVDVLGPQDATTLLTQVLGADRVHAEPVATLHLAELCGGLPLALRVVAARLAGRPDWSLTAMADELADATRRLGLLDLEDTGVRAALHLTLRQLPEPVARLFAALGRHPGSHADRYTAAALAGTNPASADTALEHLTAAHLLNEAAPGRWTMHDLVRLYARSLNAHPDTLKRVLDHYTATATAAIAAAEPGSEDCFPLPADFLPPATVREFADRTAAVAWFTAERDNLTQAVAIANTARLHERTWRIVMTMWPLIVWRVRDGWAPLLRTALVAARAAADEHGEARVLNMLGWVLTEEDRTPEALVHLEAASALAARASDAFAEANVLIVLAQARATVGQLDPGREELRTRRRPRPPDRRPQDRTPRHPAPRPPPGRRRQLAPSPHHRQPRSGLPLPTRHHRHPHILLLTIKGEALLGLGQRTEGITQLDLAAREAEAAGYDDGAVRALAALLRAALDTAVQPYPRGLLERNAELRHASWNQRSPRPITPRYSRCTGPRHGLAQPAN
ncbi:hypothetical protein [Streptomyces sp. NPDC058674]|uniref:hypothetical protein n=1 Tax=Streptomyces sp. NPDC058674 TaxID=3346592 RepID=UPI003648297C